MFPSDFVIITTNDWDDVLLMDLIFWWFQRKRKGEDVGDESPEILPIKKSVTENDDDSMEEWVDSLFGKLYSRRYVY